MPELPSSNDLDSLCPEVRAVAYLRGVVLLARCCFDGVCVAADCVAADCVAVVLFLSY